MSSTRTGPPIAGCRRGHPRPPGPARGARVLLHPGPLGAGISRRRGAHRGGWPWASAVTPTTTCRCRCSPATGLRREIAEADGGHPGRHRRRPPALVPVPVRGRCRRRRGRRRCSPRVATGRRCRWDVDALDWDCCGAPREVEERRGRRRVWRTVTAPSCCCTHGPRRRWEPCRASSGACARRAWSSFGSPSCSDGSSRAALPDHARAPTRPGPRRVIDSTGHSPRS